MENKITQMMIKKKISDMVVAGKVSYFVIFMISNFLLFLSSIGILGCAIYLFYFTRDINLFNLCNLAIALILLSMTIAAFTMRKSLYLLGIYIFLLVLMFMA